MAGILRKLGVASPRAIQRRDPSERSLERLWADQGPPHATGVAYAPATRYHRSYSCPGYWSSPAAPWPFAATLKPPAKSPARWWMPAAVRPWPTWSPAGRRTLSHHHRRRRPLPPLRRGARRLRPQRLHRGLPPGDQPFHLDAGDDEGFRGRPQSRHVPPDGHCGSPGEPVRNGPPGQSRALVLAGNDAKNLASVLADDPLRAVQSLPGVSFQQRFRRPLLAARRRLQPHRLLLRRRAAARAVPYAGGPERHRLAAPLSTPTWWRTWNCTRAPSRRATRTASAGVLDVNTRDGSRTGIRFRAAPASPTPASSPKARSAKRSAVPGWRRCARAICSISSTAPSPTPLSSSAWKTRRARLAYDLTPRNNVTLYVLESYSDLDRSSDNRPGSQFAVHGRLSLHPGNLGWRYSPSEQVDGHRATPPGCARSSTTPIPTICRWAAVLRRVGVEHHGHLDVEFAARRWMRAVAAPASAIEGYSNQYLPVVTAPQVLRPFQRQRAAHTGGYVQQSWTGWTAGCISPRARAGTITRSTAWRAISPAARRLRAGASTRLQFGWGQYVQYPELSVLTSPLGGRGLLPTRSNHAIAAVEQRLGARTRLRAEYYNRADRDLLFQPFYDPRIL